MASDSGNSDSEIDQTAPGRCTSREFVWLEGKTKSIPRGRAWDKLNRDGRVKELSFYQNWSSQRMQELILCNFPALRGQDLTRIRLYKSTSRGSQLIRICTGIPEAKEIMKLLGRSKSKKILIHLKRHNPGASSSGPPDSQTALTPPLVFAPQDTLSIISSSQSTSATSYPLSTLPSPSMATMTVPSSSTRPPVSTFSSNRSTSMYSTTTIVSTASSLVSSHLPLTTTTTRTRRPTGGHSTRQYLAQLAQSNIADGTQLAPLRIDVDSDDNLSDLLDSPLDETTVQVANNLEGTDPAQGLQTASPSKVTWLLKSFGGSDIPVTIIPGTREHPFYGEGTRAGRVTENFSANGLGGVAKRHGAVLGDAVSKMADENTKVQLVESDIPGAELPKPAEFCTVAILKRWLSCRGAKVSGNRKDLIKRVNDYINNGLSNNLVDPDGGVNVQKKRLKLGLIEEVNPICNAEFPADGFQVGISCVPRIGYNHIWKYLIEDVEFKKQLSVEKPITSITTKCSNSCFVQSDPFAILLFQVQEEPTETLFSLILHFGKTYCQDLKAFTLIMFS
ncbi:PREDICTED: uncharacterized protein LOC107356990 [Acropora digitifera]|uniref:uncharacterized protein LOC107356990 n=1 Tax=Acropora digitifera TaxID=70779 RepID=UPI00077AF3DF|nr:PREDICTED: uncharacterized protein LOC107356990 [Acropora digitifera]